MYKSKKIKKLKKSNKSKKSKKSNKTKKGGIGELLQQTPVLPIFNSRSLSLKQPYLQKNQSFNSRALSLKQHPSTVPNMIIPVNQRDYPQDASLHKFTIFSDINPWKSRIYYKFKNITGKYLKGQYDPETTFFNRKYTNERFKNLSMDEKWVSQYTVRMLKHPTLARIYDRPDEHYEDPRVQYIFQTYKIFDYNSSNQSTLLKFSENIDPTGIIYPCLFYDGITHHVDDLDKVYNLSPRKNSCRQFTSLYNYYLNQQQLLKYSNFHKDDILKPECISPLEYFKSSNTLGLFGLNFDSSFLTSPYYKSGIPEDNDIVHDQTRNLMEESHRSNPLYNSIYNSLKLYELIDLPIIDVTFAMGCAINMLNFLGWFQWRNFRKLDTHHQYYDMATSEQLVMRKFKQMLWDKDKIPSDKQMLLYAQKQLDDTEKKYKSEPILKDIELTSLQQQNIKDSHINYLKMIVYGQEKIYNLSKVAKQKYTGILDEDVSILSEQDIQNISNPNMFRGINISEIIQILKNYIYYNDSITNHQIDYSELDNSEFPLGQTISNIGMVTPFEFAFDTLDGIYFIMNCIHNELLEGQYIVIRFNSNNDTDRGDRQLFKWLNRMAHVMLIIKIDNSLFLLSISPYKSLTKITTLTLHWLWFRYRAIQIMSKLTPEQLDPNMFKDVDGVKYVKGFDYETINGLSDDIKRGLGPIFMQNRKKDPDDPTKFKHY